MFGLLTTRLKFLLVTATMTGCLSALLTVSLFGMVSQTDSVLMPAYDPLLYGAIWAGLVAVSIGASAFLSKLSSSAIYHVRTALIRRVLATSYERLESAGGARLHNVLTTDVSNVANTMSELPTFIYNVVLLTCCLSYLAILSPKMFVVLVVAITIAFFVSRTLIRVLSRHARAMREHQDTMLESYKGIFEGGAQLAIDANRKAHYYKQDLDVAAESLRRHERRFRFFWDVNRSTTAALILLFLGVLVYASRVLTDGGVLMTYTLIVTYCAGPFAIVLNLFQLLMQASVSKKKIDLLEISQDDTVAPATVELPEWNEIRLSGLEFEYPAQGPDEGFAIGPISLTISKGEVVFITGGNGSGKSTFIKALLGLYSPTSGEIMLDDSPVATEAEWRAYKSLFSVVLSDFHLFRQVLDVNGNPADDERVRQLLAMVNLDSVVKVENGRFNTVRLSQGQRKRLALVSALSEDKNVYVLDEWAADQDPNYREVFYKEIIPWMSSNGKTVIVVTHDDRYFDVAHRCIELEMGKVRNVIDQSPAAVHATPVLPSVMPA